MTAAGSVSSGSSKDFAAASESSAAAAAGAGAAELITLSLNISLTAHALGEANGIKHSDFTRYRLYLSRKLSRLRQQLNIKHGRSKYTPKPLPDCIQDNR